MVPWPAITAGSSKGCDEGEALGLGVGSGVIHARIDRVPRQDELRAGLPGGRDLGEGSSLGHEDRRGEPAGSRRVGKRLAVVAGARRDDATRPRVELGDLVEGAREA